ncbi:DUF3175 domain-containing protein [Microbulbifer sediminum]|uniref:DUF3175 domain-containing protein n=1 Tax=Microbulbifer sediminum TaxID=2904250 RepID=UPI001F20B71D|nr:DUF3175 domain-containing protein [Microbulbifer sediminum]
MKVARYWCVFSAGEINAPLMGAAVVSNVEAVMAKGKEKESGDNRQWSDKVTRTSDALDLEQGVFTLDDPAEIARSLKHSAEASERRKSDPYRSAMSMLTFYINRAGKKLPDERREVLEQAKDELRRLFGRNKSQG